MKAILLSLLILLTVSGGIARAFEGNCGYYTNRSGHVVPRPCGDWHTQQPPPGATARCRDGTYSFSEHRRGTCSRHGGVAGYR
ncbi:MAG TPA: DUF3761 domain-containing protein [Stellaceae bacterium]|nr:DUF3761 domain-containing protein [Stellaceae bacterium]